MEFPPTVFGYHFETHLFISKVIIHYFFIKIKNYFPTKAATNIGSTLIPGPIVKEIATDLKY